MTPRDQALFLILVLPIWLPFVYWWTRYCLRQYRRWAR